MEDKKFQEFVVSVKGQNDIVNTISNYTQLRKSGKNFSGLCPFHMEKSPSFSVNSEKQFYYCFGCQAGGDVIKFVSKIENISYKDSMIKLARLQGIDIPEEFRRGMIKDDSDRNRSIYNLLSDATAYFFKVLTSSSEESVAARNYLYMRGLTNEDIEQYMIGYSFFSPNKFMTAVLRSQKFNHGDLERAGLISKTAEGKHFDRFFGRVMFPIFDRSSRTIGFGGRAVRPDVAPKYLNSPETETYKKSYVFYGINYAHDAIIKTKEVILVEGYFDFISLHRSGIQNVVATCGTTLSPYHVNYIESNCNHVIFLYDMDEAGIRATMKNFELFSKADMKISVVKFEGAKDADEYINKFGLEKTGAAISQAQPFTRFLTNYAYKTFGRSDIESKTGIINFLTPHLRSISSEMTRNQYISVISQELGVSEDGIRETIFRDFKEAKNPGAAPDNKFILSPESNVKRKTQLEMLHLVIQNVECLSRLLSQVDISSSDCAELRGMVELMLGADNFSLVNDLPSVFAGSPHEALYTRLYAMPLNFDNIEKYFDDLINKYNQILRKEKIDELKLKIREAEVMGDIESSNRLLQEVSSLQKEIINI